MTSPKSIALKAVSLPGTGMDQHLAQSAFGPALASRGVDVMAITPAPARLIEGYFQAIEQAAETAERLVLTGISIGAVVAVQWALAHPTQVAGVIAALPPWTDSPADAPAALSAAYTAQALRADGLEPVVAAMRASTPAWLADLVEPAWRAQWPDLPVAMEAVSIYAHPTSAELARLDVPVALVGAIDDLVHPDRVCDEWAALIPRSAVAKVPLSDIGLDVGLIGHAGIRALESLGVTF